jgi:hypothetical protein
MNNPLMNDGVGMIVDGDKRIAMTVDQYNEALARSAKVEREEAVHAERDRIAAYAQTRFCWKYEEGKECHHDACYELQDLIELIWDRKGK